jgi:uncharacterized protein YfaT (DUF1175 family)
VRRLLLILSLSLCACRTEPGTLTLQLDSRQLPADGFSSTAVHVRSQSGQIIPADLRVLEGERIIRIEGGRIQAAVLPGRATIEARARGYRPAKAAISTTPVWSDRAGDGTPDFLRLDDPGDRDAFTRTFTELAEALYFRSAGTLPPEVTDCSSLIRYAWRETFREHDAAWVASIGRNLPQAPPQPAKYRYPFTPLGANLFRVKPGPLQPDDVSRSAFAEFADADALRRWNTHFISRDIAQAERGDLLFYRQLDQRSPFHAMIFLGPSQFEPASAPLVVYHTGPTGSDPGEVRRPFVHELLQHPLPKWRPLPGNGNFLGVYRWNILKQDS